MPGHSGFAEHRGSCSARIESESVKQLEQFSRLTFRLHLTVNAYFTNGVCLPLASVARIESMWSPGFSPLTLIAANATLREPDPITAPAPYHGDEHVWRLAALYTDTTLITGDRALFDAAPRGTTVLSPRRFITLIKSAT